MSVNASTAFDELASDYDAAFTRSTIGTVMRRATWRRLDACFKTGQRVLELNCGTGEDAVHLARRGVDVLAVDASGEMVKAALSKVKRQGLSDRIEVRRLAIEHLRDVGEGSFEGAFSNFGGLNCVADLDAVSGNLAERLQPGAMLVLCVMGPLVPWEWLWFLSRGKPGKAFRRLRRGPVQWRGMMIRYPSIGRLCRSFSPDFRLRRKSALGALVPPPYTEGWAVRHPGLIRTLNRWERRFESAPLLPSLADHYLLELERK